MTDSLPPGAPPYALELFRLANATASSLASVSDADASRFPAPGKWSPKEIIGHLIDSAENNTPRFLTAEHRREYVFDGYDQEALVREHKYGEQPWVDLLERWRGMNVQIAGLMAAIPEAVRTCRVAHHNFHHIGFRPVAASEPVTLDWLMEDYVEHLVHHLRQIDRALSSSPRT